MTLKALNPRYWWLYALLCFGRVFVWLTPFSVMMLIGRNLGLLMLGFSKRRRKIVVRNLQRCFPEWDDDHRQKMIKRCYQSFGMAMMETMIAWWMPLWRLNKIPVELQGEELVNNHNRGLMICGAHFSPMEIVGSYFGRRFGQLNLVYQKHKDPVIDHLINKGRFRYAENLVSRKDVRGMIRVMREGRFLWYAPDQDLRAKVSVFVPFFNDLCATVKLTGGLLKAGKADCVFVYFHRRDDYKGYVIRFVKPENYPSGDEELDARTYNENLEKVVREYPEQYLWLHRRFKTRPEGEPPFYE